MVNRPGTYEMSMPDDDQHALKLQRVRTTDAGQLVVTASNQFGSDLCTLLLATAGQTERHTINLAIFSFGFLGPAVTSCFFLVLHSVSQV